MATLNPRLLPLIETLIGVGADWLAIEVIETLNRGRWPEESEEVLAATRAQVRAGVTQKREVELAHWAIEPLPIPADEQIHWAAVFVAERLDAALGNLADGLANLDTIIGAPLEKQGAVKQDSRPVTVRLGTGDARAEVTSSDINQARAGMQTLRTALERWSRDASEELVE